MAHTNKTLTLSKRATDLNTAAESSNWTLVNDLLSADGVCWYDVEQCCLLHKLAAAPEVSLSLALRILTKIVKHKVDIDMVDTNGDTAVMVAARCDNTKIVMDLLSQQAALPQDETLLCSFLQTLTKNWKPQETSYMHELVVKLLWGRLPDTALDSCHKQLHHTLVRLAVTFHTSLVREMFVIEQVNAVDSEGMAVLHRVAMFDSDDHVRLLHYFISKGANVNLQNTSGDTPLHIAAKNSNWMMMEALLHRQAYCDLVNCEQRSVLHIVASYTNLEDCSNINKILPLLSRNNSDINKKDGEGNTALHLAALAGNISFMTTLLGRGAPTDGVNNEQKTVLHMMAMTKRELFSNINSCINVLVLTVKRGADIQQKNCNGNSALHLAAKHDNWGLVEFLLKYVDDAAQPDSEGFNILHRLAMTISSQGRSLFHKVVQKVGDIKTKSKTGDTAIQLAAKCQNWDIVKMLEQEGAAWDELDSEGLCVVHRYAMGKNMEHNMLSFFDICMYCNTPCWTGNTVLHLAARHGNWSLVELIVEHVNNIDKIDSEGFTVIQRLVMSTTNTFSSEYSLFCRLIELGADYTIRDENGDTVLHLAARNGHWEIVKHLAKLGADVETPDNEGFSILHRIAAEEKRSYSVTAKELSRCGAIIKQKDLQGNTPLHLAVQHKNWEVAEELVKCGADVNDVDAEGLTVLHMLGQIHNYDHSCLSLIEFLLEKGARCDIESNGGETVWKIVVENENWSMMECLLASRTLVFKEHEHKYLLHNLVCSHQGDNHIQVCDLLFQKRLPVNPKDRDGNSLLHLAAGAGNWWLVKLLIQKGARENMVDSKGLSILHRFVIGADRRMNRYTDILDMIMASGVSVNALDPRGNTALQIAAKRRLMGIVDRLIDSTENPDAKDEDGFTLLLRVSQTPSPECLSICQRLVQKGADINICSPDGESALQLAVRNNNWPVVELLMNSGARFEVEILEGLYPVHNLIKHSTFSEDSQLKLMTFLAYSEHSTSSEDNQLKLLTLLRDSGLSVSTPDPRGKTPAELAFTLKKWKLFIYLLESGGHLNPPLRNGNSYFHEFARNTSACSNMIDITRLLLSRGFDINLRNDDGDTPVHVAADKDNWDTVKTFVEHGASTSIPDSKGYYLLHKLLNKQTQNIAIYIYHSKTSTYESLEQLLIRTLVTHGEDVNRRGPDNKTALQIAAGNDEWEIVGKLISLGAVYELNQNEKLSALKHLDSCHWEDVTREQLHLFIKYIANDGSAINNSFQEEYGYRDPKTALQKCVEQANLKMAIALVECGADVSNILRDEALLELMMSRYSQENHATWMCFLDLLISRGLDINTKLVYRSGVLFSNDVCESLGESEENVTSCLFSALLERGADPLLVHSRGHTLLRTVVDFDEQRTLNALKKLLPAGVTTHQPRLTEARFLSHRGSSEQTVSPTEKAVQRRHISAVKLLIQSGASSNAELFRLNTEYQVKMAVLADTNNDVRELLEVLSKAASEPHSLQSLCRLSVSHWLGCGPGRADKLKSLKIPSSLKNLISFCDLLSTEFVLHKHEDLSSRYLEEDDDYSDYNDSDRSIDYSS